MRAAFTIFALAAAFASPRPAIALECSSSAPCCQHDSGPCWNPTPNLRYRWAPSACDLTLDLRASTFLSDQNELSPLHVINGNHTGLYAIGGRIVGQQSRELTWRIVKDKWDGNGLTVRGPGVSTIEGMYIENFEDAISPIEAVTKWVVKDVYAKYIRDEFVENDQLQPGIIENTLVDGTFVFLSNRPGAAGGKSTCNGRPSDPNLQGLRVCRSIRGLISQGEQAGSRRHSTSIGFEPRADS